MTLERMSFKDYFVELKDPRVDRKKLHLLIYPIQMSFRFLGANNLKVFSEQCA